MSRLPLRLAPVGGGARWAARLHGDNRDMHDADAMVLERPILNCRSGFPDALLDVPASELWRHLSGPTLFDIPGRRPQPLFVCVLLHGNEDTGWRAIQDHCRASSMCRGY